MCAVHNMMWLGTSAGEIKVFNAVTLKIKFICTLTASEISNIVHVEEMQTVLVSNSSGEVWSFYDFILDDGMRLQSKVTLDDSPCNLIKVYTISIWLC